jgi:metallo-beta-lactamase class B
MVLSFASFDLTPSRRGRAVAKSGTSAPTDLITRIDKLALFLWIATSLCAAPATAQKAATKCSSCAVWNLPQKPFRIYGNSYYVGTHGLSSVLITSDRGHILIDGDLSESAPQIVANIEALGFRIEDVKIILNSHVHYDHAGGIAELQRRSGAQVWASPWTARVMKKGGFGRGDPQYGLGISIAPSRNVHELKDGDPVRVGSVSVTAHFTPGHTPGGTSWTWSSCEGTVCRNFVYADSLTPVSADGFSFLHSRTYPQVLQDFEKSYQFLESAQCDILITTHPEVSGLWDRLNAREKSDGPDSMLSPGACRDLAHAGREQLRQRLDRERANQPAKPAK